MDDSFKLQYLNARTKELSTDRWASTYLVQQITHGSWQRWLILGDVKAKCFNLLALEHWFTSEQNSPYRRQKIT
ncbi:hypothetical protein EK904_011064 [Melospiza melodia maxima]|nr:hypothetical protein EK904_011064 [Melospiza melodia maxima]